MKLRKLRHKTLIWTAFLSLTFLFVYTIFYQNQNHFRRKNILATKKYSINTKGCRIPFLELRDEEIENLSSDISGYTCSKIPPLIESNLTHIYINSSVLEIYGIKKIEDLVCHYKEFWRVKPKNGQEDIQVKFGEPVSFTSSIQVDGENYRVECRNFLAKYIDYHYFVPKKKFKYQTIENNIGCHGNENGCQQNQVGCDGDLNGCHGNHLNIIISGIDSLSRIHVKRKMPKTVKYLLEDLGAIEYQGYTKVGLNTFPNLIPLFTGYSFDELVEKCWPNYESRFDNCSFIWSNFSKNGYITSFAEEQSYFGLFNYLKKGFSEQQVDYNWDYFDRTSSDDIGHYYDLFRTYPMCMGPRPMFEILLKSSEKFIEKMKSDKFFMFYWQTTLAHNNIDTGMLGDQKYLEHFQFLEQSGVLNRSLFIFMSDHGYRYGKMVETHQGRLEDRLPFIYFVFPKWFKSKYSAAYSNIEKNALRLMTTFDVFATLNQILEPQKLENDYIISEKITDIRGVSLFNEISENRTCQSGGIPSHFCTCHELLPIGKTDTVVMKIIDFVVNYLNNLLSQYDTCAEIVLYEIVSADLVTYGDVFHTNVKTVSDYTITFKTNPGEAYFDATVRCNICDENDFQLTAPVGRLNRYENQSFCIKDFTNQPYCYCKAWLENKS